jgi:hypothetical protein
MQWPVDSYKSLVSFFGDPDSNNDGLADRDWEDANLIRITAPWQMHLSWAPTAVLRLITIHSKCAASLGTILNSIWVAFEQDQAKIEYAGLNSFGGAYNFRRKRGLASLSTHAFGAAVDFAPTRNPLGRAWKPNMGMMPEVVISIFKSEGWVWGGDWKSRPDPMHFQAAVGISGTDSKGFAGS